MTNQLAKSVQENLEKVLQEHAPLDAMLSDNLAAKLSLDTSLEVNDPTIFDQLVPLLLQCLRTPLAIDYNVVLRLLQCILEKTQFEKIIQLITENDLLDALNSGDDHLQRLCLSQIKRSPRDFLKDSPLLPAMLQLYGSSDTDSAIINEIAKTVFALCEVGDLTRKRLFDGACLVILKQLHDGNGTQQGRLMVLIEGLLPYDTCFYIPSTLIQFAPQSIAHNDDMLLVMNKIQMYKELLTNPHPSQLIEIISEQVKAICHLFLQRDTNEEVKMFLLNEIINFFGALSRAYPAAFSDVDKYVDLASSGLLTNYNNDHALTTLATLDPNYLVQAHPDVIRQIPFRARTLVPLRNIYKSQQAYELSKPTSDLLLALPYLELMFILGAITSTPWGTADLLQNWPRVMDSLLSHEGIRDRDTASFRREVFENLLMNPSETLSIWFDRLREGYAEIIHGIPVLTEPGILIADESKQ